LTRLAILINASGYLNSELFRASRLVVDTGLNYFDWDIQKAVNYLVNEGLQHSAYSVSESIRYIGIPAQACSYKIGELQILKLREKAKKELGWEAKLPLKRMCEDSWRWQIQNPNGYQD